MPRGRRDFWRTLTLAPDRPARLPVAARDTFFKGHSMTRETEMWAHWCECERGLLWVGSGEACNWCDVRELRCVDVEGENERK